MHRRFIGYDSLQTEMSAERCCCNLCYVKTVMWLIASIELFIFSLALVLGFVDGDADDEAGQRQIIIQTFVFSLWIVLVVLLLIGLSTNRPSLLLPHLAFTLLAFVIDGVLGVVQMINSAEGSQVAGLVVVWIVVLGLVIVELRCYSWMKWQ